VLWIQDLLKTTPRQLEFDDDILQQEARGVDMYVLLPNRLIDRGTGASCIYPLLACTLFPWSMCGTGIPLQDVVHIEISIANLCNTLEKTST